MENRGLYEENARLNDLARMLLGSPHFANFLNEMPDSVPAQIQAPQQPQSQPQPQPQPQQQQQQQQPQSQPQQVSVPKESAAPRAPEYQMQQNPQVSMVMVPTQGMDASMMNAGWNSGIDMNFGNPSVFAVLDVPEGPAFDIETLSGKNSSPLGTSESSKDVAPVIECPENEDLTQKCDIGTLNPDIDIDESDPAFALFIDTPATPEISGDELVFDGVQSQKPDTHYELVVDLTNAQSRLNMLCSSMEAAFERVSSVTSHLQ